MICLSPIAKAVYLGNPHQVRRESEVRRNDLHRCGERIRRTTRHVDIWLRLDLEKALAV